MPKIGKEYYAIRGKRTEVVAYYTRQKHFFLKGLPTGVVEYSGDKFLHGFSTEEKMWNCLNITLEDYHNTLETIEKVNVYEVRFSVELSMNKSSEGGFVGFKPWVPELMRKTLDGFNKGNGFVINWKVLFQKTRCATSYYAITDDDGIGRKEHISGMQIIGWSREREEAMIALDKAFEEMARKVTSVLGDKQKTLAFLDSGQKLLGR